MSQEQEQASYEERRRTFRKKRKEAHLSQGRLAALAGIGMHTLTKFESGVRDLAPKRLEKIAEARTDVMAAQRMIGITGTACQQHIAPLSQMAPPPAGTL
jgi:transcriptional regulator with XRE-family HTH domain